MINARAEREDLDRKIREEVQKILKSLESEVDVARAKEQQLQRDLDRLENKAGSELKDTVQLRQLQREADANRTLYESFLGRFKQTAAQQEMQLPDTRIIAHADLPLYRGLSEEVVVLDRWRVAGRHFWRRCGLYSRVF